MAILNFAEGAAWQAMSEGPWHFLADIYHSQYASDSLGLCSHVVFYFAVDVELFHKSTNCLIKVKIAKLISVIGQKMKENKTILQKIQLHNNPLKSI